MNAFLTSYLCRYPLLLALLIAACAIPATGQQAIGRISGHVKYGRELGREEEGREREYRLEIVEVSTETEVQEAYPDSDGAFLFVEVPFGAYHLNLLEDDVLVNTQYVRVATPAPVRVEIDAVREVSGGEVIITASRFRPDNERTGTVHTFTANSIQTFPTVASDKKIESMLLHVPGVVPDEDGRMHIRGEDAQIQYVIDGIPITTNLTRVYSTLFSADLIKTAEVLTGGFDAEYGTATAAVLSITTKSGFDRPFFARATSSVGSFNTGSVTTELGGNISSSMGEYVAANVNQSDRYLDPVAGFDALHDEGNSEHYFGKLSIIPAQDVDIAVLGGYNHTEFSVPNKFVRQPAQNQGQDLDDYTVGASGRYYAGETTVISAVGYHRNSSATFTSNGLMRITTPEDSIQALAENERFFIGAERTYSVTGGAADISFTGDWADMQHTLKVGVAAEQYPIDEFFTFAVTDPALSNPDTAGGDVRYRPYDISQGGAPFLVDESATGSSYSAFVQDRMEFGRWVINAGVRFDRYELLTSETALSPRLSASYTMNDDMVLRASYNRIVMRAPLENILVSGSDEALMLTGLDQGDVPTRVTSERAHQIEIGVANRVNDVLSLDVAAYGKFIENFVAKVELGNSGIIFPVNLKTGVVAGGEATLNLRNWNNFSAELFLSGGVALGIKPDDGSSPVAAGLILGEEGKNYSHPFAGENEFPTEHNQLFTAGLNIRYNSPDKWFVLLDGRFDSGLPFDLTGENGEGLTAEESIAELRNRGYTDDVIDLLELEPEEPGSPDKSVAPHAIFDLGAGINFNAFDAVDLRFMVSVANILDTPYLYKFESSFGGTHFGKPRMVTAEVQLAL